MRPRVRALKDCKLPVNVSLSFEFAFPRPQYDANSVTLEIRPIIEKSFANFRLSFNPVVGRALRGPDSDEGFDFEPGAKFAWFVARRRAGLEYYGSTGPVTGFHPIGEQVHLLFPSVDIYFTPNTMINLGVGFGLTGAGERLIWQTRIGWRS